MTPGEDSVCVIVTNAGDGFNPTPRVPTARDGGFGLYLLEKTADRWGVDSIGGTRVWFELSES
jgi:hypothetical protein